MGNQTKCREAFSDPDTLRRGLSSPSSPKRPPVPWLMWGQVTPSAASLSKPSQDETVDISLFLEVSLKVAVCLSPSEIIPAFASGHGVRFPISRFQTSCLSQTVGQLWRFDSILMDAKYGVVFEETNQGSDVHLRWPRSQRKKSKEIQIRGLRVIHWIR